MNLIIRADFYFPLPNKNVFSLIIESRGEWGGRKIRQYANSVGWTKSWIKYIKLLERIYMINIREGLLNLITKANFYFPPNKNVFSVITKQRGGRKIGQFANSVGWTKSWIKYIKPRGYCLERVYRINIKRTNIWRKIYLTNFHLNSSVAVHQLGRAHNDQGPWKMI